MKQSTKRRLLYMIFFWATWILVIDDPTISGWLEYGALAAINAAVALIVAIAVFPFDN